MLIRPVDIMSASLVIALGMATTAAQANDWQSAEIVVFTDFDELEVKLNAKLHKAFLVGLRPLRETIKDEAQRARTRSRVVDQLHKSELFAQVVTQQADRVGLSIDAFTHLKHSFGHTWDPNKYPYCWSGWGAYNFNTYFLYANTTTFLDNFGENARWRERFNQLVQKMDGKSKN